MTTRPHSLEESTMVPAASQILVRRAARALDRHGLVHAYGHCSTRLSDSHFLVCAPKPMGTIGPQDDGTIVPIYGDLPEHVLGEVRIHREIYRRRPEVGGVVRSMPPSAMSLSALGRTPRALHGMGSYFAPAPALWDDPQLIRTDAAANALADQLGDGNAIVMRGNGVVTASVSLEEAVSLTWYLDDAARIELDCLAQAHSVRELSAAEAQQRATRSGRIFERMWDYLTWGDPE
ncbi:MULTISPECIES: class II aldolase/adducin family protein [unclassified Oceanobacter]|uniref:class II aldolase/adducin family protein n=2 Tax=Gammaproteobacteria TaxID=1236 RepID=UPI0026E335AD|nr:MULTISPECIES: class II aldolase/adducin family protein [unclassified Oceanobacter]MDO6683709.1 class II aldolase/adducin family protein [Oceanobacter sp. 5_MG-2023]MDP2549410.1 class II aldolase/adducin family protein [Oceanobacter sp. 4_MG-2023]MDP2608326.1 class II aldolase/adducin family protein [Oceanobacter sp. 1_MG-2023]MDP2612211.1 class II aldolase/adducin family protein [Oceanobacter sp. 2_MG-2023]